MTPAPAAVGRAKRRRKREPVITLADESLVERVAHIMGEGSASARALGELRRRRAAGEDVALFTVPGMMLVGPAPSARPGGDGRSGDV